MRCIEDDYNLKIKALLHSNGVEEPFLVLHGKISYLFETQRFFLYHIQNVSSTHGTFIFESFFLSVHPLQMFNNKPFTLIIIRIFLHFNLYISAGNPSGCSMSRRCKISQHFWIDLSIKDLVKQKHQKRTFFRLNLAVFISDVLCELNINIYMRICVKLCVLSPPYTINKKSGAGSNTHPDGWDREVISCQGLHQLLQLTDLSSCFLRLGFVQSSVGCRHVSEYFWNEQYLCTKTLENFGKNVTLFHVTHPSSLQHPCANQFF